MVQLKGKKEETKSGKRKRERVCERQADIQARQTQRKSDRQSSTLTLQVIFKVCQEPQTFRSSSNIFLV